MNEKKSDCIDQTLANKHWREEESCKIIKKKHNNGNNVATIKRINKIKNNSKIQDVVDTWRGMV